MLQICTNEKAEAVVRADYWEFDRLYFAIARFTGAYGLEKVVPFKGYDAVCENLLGLNYEIRHAQRGERELYIQNSGIHMEWFKTRKRIDVTEEFRELENDMDYNGIDLEKFYDLDRDEKEDVLIDHGYDADEYEAYLDAFDEDFIRFRREDYPDASEYNTLFQFRISVYEALYYALIIRELLPKKDEYLEKLRRDAEAPQFGIEQEFYHVQVWQELDLIDLYKNSVFRSVYHILKEDRYVHYEEEFRKHPDGLKNADLARCNQLVEQYQQKAPGEDLRADLCAFLDQFLACLG